MRKYAEGGETKKETFGEAFRRNRAKGEKTFEWNGKKYTTEIKEEKEAREAKAKVREATEERRMADIGDKYRAEKQAAAAPKARARISSEDVSPPAGTKLSYDNSRAFPIESRSVPKGGGGGGGGTRVEPMLGADLDPKRIVGGRMEPSFKNGGKVIINKATPYTLKKVKK